MPPTKYTHWKNSDSKYAACGVPNSSSKTEEKLHVTCPKCLRMAERSDRILALPRKCYESVVGALKISLPTWDELPEDYRHRYEKEVNEGIELLLGTKS